MFNGYECAYVDMNMSPPGSLSSTPTFIPSHGMPARNLIDVFYPLFGVNLGGECFCWKSMVKFARTI
jgi:hypothetical protein